MRLRCPNFVNSLIQDSVYSPGCRRIVVFVVTKENACCSVHGFAGFVQFSSGLSLPVYGPTIKGTNDQNTLVERTYLGKFEHQSVYPPCMLSL